MFVLTSKICLKRPFCLECPQDVRRSVLGFEVADLGPECRRSEGTPALGQPWTRGQGDGAWALGLTWSRSLASPTVAWHWLHTRG